MKKLLVPAAAGVLLFAACGGTPKPAAPAAPQNVLLITIDTLRADRLDNRTMPNVSAFASKATRFTNARTVVPLTEPSHTTILTGAWPSRTGIHVNGTVPATPQKTIAGVLHDRGYRTGAFVGAYVLDRRFGLSIGFDTYDDRIERDPSGAPRLEAERRGDHVVDAALRWLRRDDGHPFFAWIHLYDPHAPYQAPPEFQERMRGQPYDAEVLFADAQVGRVLEWLKTSGQDPRTIVAITGDHGEGLGDHGEATHGMLAYDSTLRVPLVIRPPNQEPRTVDAPVSLVDLSGTLLDLAGVVVPESMHHVSIFSDSSTAHHPASDGDVFAETQYPRTAGWHSLTALVDGRWKLIASSQAELYDLQNDPSESHNVAGDRGALAASMRSRATRLATAADAVETKASGDVSERLRSLGYVAAPATVGDADNAPNPAEHVYAWNTFERVLSKLSAGDAAGALPGLGKLARAYPDARVFQSTYAQALEHTGRVRDALDVYRRAVSRWPRDADLYHDLAVAAAAAGRSDEAARAEQASLAIDPLNASAANGLGLVEAGKWRAEDAAHAFERAVRGDPTNAVYWTNLGNARRDAGNPAGAEEAYRTALEHDPRSADAANGIGVLLVQRNQPADAIAWFERALAGDDTFVDAHLNLGIAYQESGQPDKAMAQYRRVLALAPPGSKPYTAAAALLQGK